MSFDKAFDDLISLEGGYSDDENDPGNWTGGKVNAGKLKGTHWGISAAQYPDEDIISLTRDDAKIIYRSDFWDLLKCDTINDEVAGALFKCGVNQGPGTAARVLQQAVGVTPDGVIGPKTVGVINTFAPDETLERFLTLVILKYVGMSNFDRDGKGWVSRVVKTALQAKSGA